MPECERVGWTALRATLAYSIPLAILSSSLPLTSGAQLAEADRAWKSRAEMLDDRFAAADQIEESIRSYRAAVVAKPESLEARWKLLRAHHYLVDFSNAPQRRKEAAVEQSISLAKGSLEFLEAIEGDPANRARLHFWSAIAWGMRAQRVGLLTIVREGAASRMHDLAERSLSLDPSVDQGGALRLLSRLHATLPRVPFVSGWVDRGKVLPFAERAFALDGQHPGNQLILALALLERAPERRAQAGDLLRSAAEGEPRSDSIAEDLAIGEQAREHLQALLGDSA